MILVHFRSYKEITHWHIQLGKKNEKEKFLFFLKKKIKNLGGIELENELEAKISRHWVIVILVTHSSTVILLLLNVERFSCLLLREP